MRTHIKDSEEYKRYEELMGESEKLMEQGKTEEAFKACLEANSIISKLFGFEK